MTNHIEENIIDLLKKQKTPIHTNFIAEKLKFSWNTVRDHPSQLKEKKKINGCKVGKVNLWWI